MNISLDLPSAGIYIRHYEPGRVTLNTGIFEESILLSPSAVVLWPAPTMDALSADALSNLLTPHSDVILLGTGETQVWLPASLRALVAQSGKVMDIMPSKSACRTYNLLVSEGRNVILGLMV